MLVFDIFNSESGNIYISPPSVNLKLLIGGFY